MADGSDERLQDELALLEAMYPDQVVYSVKAREVKYTDDAGSFAVRLHAGYPVDTLPEVLEARIHKNDVREDLRKAVHDFNIGEEVLDSVIAAFTSLTEAQKMSREADQANEQVLQASKISTKDATVVVWLHHLLNTNKRKQALSAPSSAISGITKPGYPGVLIYSGPAEAVHEHVNELKSLNWQAFQVRLESDEAWTFSHGNSVREVESMKDVVAAIGDARKDVFMEAMRMK